MTRPRTSPPTAREKREGGETDEARGRSPGRQTRKPPTSPRGRGRVPHPQPADRPPRAWGSQRRRPEGLGLLPPCRPPGPPFGSLPRPRAAPRPAPRSSRVAASTTAAGPWHRPPLLSSLSAPPRRPAPPASACFGLALPVRGAEAAAGGSERGRAATEGDWAAAGTELGLWSRRCRLKRAGAAQPAAMAGYARCPGVTPLSRARSLVIPDGERAGGGRAAAAQRPRRGPGEAGAGEESLLLLLQLPRSMSAGLVSPARP